MFAKGQSGNPSGRPKMPDELRRKLRDGAAEAVDLWREIIADEGAAKRDRIKAGELCCAYAYGKPVQAVELGDGDGNPLGPVLVNVKFEKTGE